MALWNWLIVINQRWNLSSVRWIARLCPNTDIWFMWLILSRLFFPYFKIMRQFPPLNLKIYIEMTFGGSNSTNSQRCYWLSIIMFGKNYNVITRLLTSMCCLHVSYVHVVLRKSGVSRMNAPTKWPSIQRTATVTDTETSVRVSLKSYWLKTCTSGMCSKS